MYYIAVEYVLAGLLETNWIENKTASGGHPGKAPCRVGLCR